MPEKICPFVVIGRNFIPGISNLREYLCMLANVLGPRGRGKWLVPGGKTC